jgi:hypothetical protein
MVRSGRFLWPPPRAHPLRGMPFASRAQFVLRSGAPLVAADTWCETATVKAKLVVFGEIQIEGERYARDVVIDGGRISRRRKGPSKALRDQFGHTPLSVAEVIPWGGHRLIVGTGANGRLPIAADVYAEAERRGIGVAAVPTADACRLLADMKSEDVYAVLHVTC